MEALSYICRTVSYVEEGRLSIRSRVAVTLYRARVDKKRYTSQSKEYASRAENVSDARIPYRAKSSHTRQVPATLPITAKRVTISEDPGNLHAIAWAARATSQITKA
jgi:hypothetical protein